MAPLTGLGKDDKFAAEVLVQHQQGGKTLTLIPISITPSWGLILDAPAFSASVPQNLPHSFHS